MHVLIGSGTRVPSKRSAQGRLASIRKRKERRKKAKGRENPPGKEGTCQKFQKLAVRQVPNGEL